MNLSEIQAAVRAGRVVHWATRSYVVELHHLRSTGEEQWLVHCTLNNNYVGLTHRDGVTLNGREEQFFLGEEVRP